MRAGITLILTLGLASCGSIAPALGAEHPRLVDPAVARCSDCHDDLWETGAALHPPVEDDCTTCHEFSRSEDGGMAVSLMEKGTALCLVCHDMEAEVEADLETPHFPVSDSCLNCHDPHASQQPHLLKAPLGEVCGECHDRDDLNQTHDDQLTEATRCTVCHLPHGSDNGHMLLAAKQHAPFSDGSCKGCHREPISGRVRLRSRGNKLCVACHGEFEAPDGGSLHPALAEARQRPSCLSCHSPHMSPYRMLLLRPGNETCRTCHGEIVEAAQAETGHAAAADDCLTCHLPHEASEPKLLNLPREELCVLCHEAEDDDLIDTHQGADLGRLECTSCHTPHGSGNPSLLAENLHGALEGGCDTCHDGAFDHFVEQPPELCLTCHDEVGKQASEAAVPHLALEVGTCVDCHNPHASPQVRLIKLPGGRECTECHDDKLPAQDEQAHGVIGLIGCRACHEPHGGSRPRLLRMGVDELCRSCHEERLDPGPKSETVQLLGRFEVPRAAAGAVFSLRLSADGQRNHPVTDHRTLGTPTQSELKGLEGLTFSGELSCLTCHNPHKGRSKLLNWGATSSMEACTHCHLK